MAHESQEQGVTPSVLDRLTDVDSGGTRWRRGYGVDQMAKAVARDLEELLNTRQTNTDLPETYAEVHRSLIGYGMPDLASLNALTPKQREEVGRVIEAVIARFEPRLRDIQATLVDASPDKDRNITFRITARLFMTPSLDVAFATDLQLSTGQYKVKDSS